MIKDLRDEFKMGDDVYVNVSADDLYFFEASGPRIHGTDKVAYDACLALLKKDER
jgi:hypothetical protein